MRPINLYEDVVEMLVDEMVEAGEMCACERCRSDVMAFALNSLKPQYVVSDIGKAYVHNRTQMSQAKIDAYRAVLSAVEKVKDRPRHDKDQGWQ